MKSDKIEQMDKNEEMSSFKMSERNYIIFKEIADNHFEGLDKNITDYVRELRKQNAELFKILASVKKIIDIYELYNDLCVELFYDDLEKLLKEYKG